VRISSAQLNQIICEEVEKERIYIILKEEEERIRIIHQEIDKDKLLCEFELADVGHLALDIGGAVGDIAYGSGAFFDVANAAWYAKKGEYLMGAMSVISMIPGIGDIVGKGGKLTMIIGKGGGKAGGWLGKTLSKYMPQITKFFKGLSKNKKLAKFIEPMLDSLKAFIKKAVDNPKAKEVMQGLQKVASTKKVVPVKGGKLAKLKAVVKRSKQKTSARKRLEKGTQELQGQEEEV